MKKILPTLLTVWDVGSIALAIIFPPFALGLRKRYNSASGHADLVASSSFANLSILFGAFSGLSIVGLYSESARDWARRSLKFVVPLGLADLLTGVTAKVLEK